jgi:hypothetical protein
MEIEGEKVQTVQKMTGSYSNINEIDDITIPAEVKKGAVEMDDSAMPGE